MSTAMLAIRKAARAALPILGLVLLASCAAPRPGTPPPSGPPPAPAVAGAPWQIDGGQSQVLVFVYKEGTMARIGHNHVLSVQQITGELQLGDDPAQSAFMLRFPVSAIVVDDPVLRGAQGPDFQTPITDTGVAGTREHMLAEPLLDAAHFPEITLASAQIQPAGDDWQVLTRITVRDHTAEVPVAVQLERREGSLLLHGQFTVTHTQLGLTPMSVMFGALKVADALRVEFSLVARQPQGSVSNSNAVPSGASSSALLSGDKPRGSSLANGSS
ncbi:MAG TPA: YceI family protein [Steroidobacteraceae bacterium]